MSEDQANKITREFWGSNDPNNWRSSQLIHWLEHPRVQARNAFLVCGDPARHRWEYFISRYFGQTKVQRVITLGCGHGDFERAISAHRLAEIHDAVDISEGAIADARKQAKDLGFDYIHYEVANLNTLRLPKNTYDVVFGISSIHHVSELEHLFRQVARSLKPNGYFYLDEYVGPSKFQWTSEQLTTINNQIARLPPRLARSIVDGAPKRSVIRCTLEQMDAADPSEAVRSADILKLLPKYFDVIELKGSGGTILHMLLEEITGNFVEDDPEAMQYLQSFFDLEDRLIAEGKLQHDFAVVIARKKRSRADRLKVRVLGSLIEKARAFLKTQ